ncbi:MAG: iron chelate uptake ABC transporter family permease subunit [Desulfatitalea sp.]|nr:metal ABC transporter permease [Desulfatitalea sp.]NNJ99408.1 iron chelate uptake ABC transporter family permease subunit [Desulfatitalea sp.]
MMPVRTAVGSVGRIRAGLPALFVVLGWGLPVHAASLAEAHFQWPAVQELLRVMTLQDYNTRVVIIGTTLLGLAAGLSGTFLILRKRALLSDALSHATLPGIALAFIVMTLLLEDGKHLIGLILGAAIFAVLGTGSVLLIQRYSRLKDDAALGVVLSVYFGLGIAVMGIATRMSAGNAAGLSSFIYGKTASMLFADALLIAVAAFLAAALCLLFFKEFALICFDADFAVTQGWPVGRLDFFMMTLVVVVTVVGLQAVGLILVVALLIIPPSAARFWSRRLGGMLWLSAFFGALSGMIGAGISALMANLPAGAVIVLTAAAVFSFSLVFGTAGGLLSTALDRVRLKNRVVRENLLRQLYEWREDHLATTTADVADAGPCLDALMAGRSWKAGSLQRVLRRLIRKQLLRQDDQGRFLFSPAGLAQAHGVVRKHRLWEAYLITHADTAPGQVDWGADAIEHVLDARIIAELEARLPGIVPDQMPRSPHGTDWRSDPNSTA